MTPQHWIITNRPVLSHKKKGDYVEEGHDYVAARPEFRIARFTPPTKPAKKLKDEDYQAAVAFTPDDYPNSYDSLAPDADPEGVAGTQQLFLALYQDMLAAPREKGDVLIFLHGYNYTWNDSLRHLHRLHQLYAAPADSPVRTILYFSWPSVGDLFRYKVDQKNGSVSGWMLGRLFGKVIQFYADFFNRERGADRPAFCGKHIHLAAHSMGNQVLEHLFKAINGVDFYRKNLFEEILMLNADADWDALEPGRPLHQLTEYGNRLHIYNNRSDDALDISVDTKNDKKRLGRHGPRDLTLIPPHTLVVDTTSDPADLNDSLSDASMQEDPFAVRATRIVSRNDAPISIKEVLIDHWGYLYRPAVIEDIKAVLRGQSSSEIEHRTPKDRHLYRLDEA